MRAADWIVPAVLVVVFFGIACSFARCKLQRHRLKMAPFDFRAECERLREAGYTDIDAEKVPREIKRSDVSKIGVLGAGAFGEVWKGMLDESREKGVLDECREKGGAPGYPVVVKVTKSKEGEGAKEMLREAALMAQIDMHPNLVSLIGVVTAGEPPLLLLLSYCEKGALSSVLKRRKASGASVPTGRKLQMLVDIASGMAHLAAHGVIHRHLAAYNVLVDSSDTCKVAIDFDLSSTVFPVRWAAPEAMETFRFNEATDVWSFGVVMLEVFTDAAKPYADMDNAQVMTKVFAGHRHPKPADCPAEIYSVMLKCWSQDASDRPMFAELVGLLEAVITIRRGYIYCGKSGWRFQP